MDTFIVTHLECGDTLYLDTSYGFQTNYCTRNHHTSFERKLLIDFRDGKSYFFDGRYCLECGRAYVARNYYASTINPKGTHDLTIDIVLQDGSLLSDETKSNVPLLTRDDFAERAERSLLNKYGYNVGQTDNLSDKERQDILKGIIDRGELSPGYICSHIRYLIKINGKRDTNWLAVQKWKRDLEYVQSLNKRREYTLEDFLRMAKDDTKDDELPF